MLSLASGRLVNRDQFRILPMPDSVIKRLNELALADGRVKGKGELYAPPTSYVQDSDAKRGLPDTMETTVNNGIDPSIAISDSRDNSDVVDGVLKDYQHDENGGTDYPQTLTSPVTATI